MRDAPPELIAAFYDGRLSVAFPAGADGIVFVTCERDNKFPLRVLKFRRVGEAKPFREYPCPSYKAGEHLRNFLFIKG